MLTLCSQSCHQMPGHYTTRDTFHFLTWAQYIHYFTETFLDESENGFEYLAILSLTRKFTLSMLSAQFGILWNSPENDLLTSQ